MADKHTRGPWRIFRDGASNDTAYVRTEAEFGAGEIAVLYSQPNEADALLIAAAPELLEALEFVEAFFTKLEDGTEPDDPLRKLREKCHAPIHDRVRPLIRKARGESQ